MVSFSELPSRIAGDAACAANRIDPYWGGLWNFGSSLSWLSYGFAHKRESNGLTRLPADVKRLDPEVARGRLRNSAWDAKLDFLSVADHWRTATVEQAAAFTGRKVSLLGGEKVLGDLWALNVLDRDSSIQEIRGVNYVPASFFRLSRSQIFDAEFRPLMTKPELASVLGGESLATDGRYDRHNVLSTELALRVAEFTPAASVLGEKLSLANTLAFAPSGLQPINVLSKQRGDFTMIRSDGVKVVFEVTASASSSMDEKVAKWARIFARDSIDLSGVVVVFVCAGEPSDEPLGVVTATRKAVARVLQQWPGREDSRTAGRIFVADWREWFPAEGQVSEAFPHLVASRMRAGVWEEASLLSESDIVFNPRFDATAIIENVRLLRATPYWMRKGWRPQVWRETVGNVFPGGAPVPMFSRQRGHFSARVPERFVS